MRKRLFLLDGMALVYRAHFAFIGRPIRTSRGFNTSALYGFVTTLLDILEKGEPTHLAVAFDTEAPTPRHREFPAYKATRQEMPEELSAALPHVRRFVEAFRLRSLSLDGYEADDLIGTLARRAEAAGFETFMVTPDKDFGQLVTERTRLWRPGYKGGDAEIWGPAEVCARWGIARVDQVVDLLGLMGDASDNIPGVPGVGEKTAAKLIAQYGSLEGVLAHAGEIKGKLGEALRQYADQARLSRRLATILTDVPLAVDLEDLRIGPRDDAALRALCAEFEFNAIGRRLFGDQFHAGRASPHAAAAPAPKTPAAAPPAGERDLFGQPWEPAGPRGEPPAAPVETAPEPVRRSGVRTLAEVPHRYELVNTPEALNALVKRLAGREWFAVDTETDHLDPQQARLLGVAFSDAAGTGWYVPVSGPDSPALAALKPLLEDPRSGKVGHNLKFDLNVLRWHGVTVRGPLFDTMIAHAVLEPEQRHGLNYCAEVYLNYAPIPIEQLIGPRGPGQRSLAEVPPEHVAEYAAEDADVAWQLQEHFRPLLRAHHAERVFFEVEMPALPAIAAMEFEGVRVDAGVLAELSAQLARLMAEHERAIHRLAGVEFNVNSNKQLGEVLFEKLRLADQPKRTATGQYATDEQTLQALAGDHEIVRRVLEYRAVAKLKSTYADALPAAISPRTGRVHTTFHQAATVTGRLSSQDPNLQNIPIRSDLGQEIRRAFVAREPGPDGAAWAILSADYSQIELRILAAMSGEPAMIEAFRRGADIHAATATRVFGVAPEAVTPEQRRQAKVVNFGIVYGISAFGLAQRLGIPRANAAALIEQYFASYPGIRDYIERTLAEARQRGYVETLTGRRRVLRDINSANATVRGAAERNAINTPIQGTAADMIKLAMGRIHAEFERRGLRSRMVLQVHDELVFDLCRPEEAEVRELVAGAMRHALPLPHAVPVEVDLGVGPNWLEAH
jgi:DNA polymerase-1